VQHAQAVRANDERQGLTAGERVDKRRRPDVLVNIYQHCADDGSVDLVCVPPDELVPLIRALQTAVETFAAAKERR